MSRAVIANLQSFLDRWPGELLGDGFDGDADNIREAIAEIRRLDRLTSPAHTSEARDAVVGEVVEIGDDDEGQPRILIHTTREAIKNGPPLAFRTVRVAAMRQEAGSRD